MNQPTDVYGSVLAEGTVLLLARVAFADGQHVVPADIASASYTIQQQSSCAPGASEPIEGHAGVALVPTAILYESLQTESPWEIDETGYNFRHEVDVLISAAFPASGVTYAVRYQLTPTSGQPIHFRFLIEAV